MSDPLFDLDELTGLIDHRLPNGRQRGSSERVKKFMDNSIVSSVAFPDVAYNGGDMWNDESDRSLGRILHGFIFLRDWPHEAFEDRSGTTTRTALDVVREWQRRFAFGRSEHQMAFHDETTAQRLNSLLALHPAFKRYLPPEDLSEVVALLDETAGLLTDEGFHSAGNNHGMFQDLALLTYAVKATWRTDSARSDLFELAERRLMEYFLSTFTVDGVHRENAPTYHLMIARQVRQHHDLLRACGHSDAKVLEDLLAKAAVYATHAVQPDGQFPPISDSQRLDLAAGARATFDDPNYQYAATAGRTGTKPTSRTLVLPDSGYAIYRSAWGDPDATYVFFNAAYNADYHKHSDDLSLFVRHRGLDLLAEAGPYGYNYSDPLTKYGFSQFAHNNVVVDRRSIPRTDGLSNTVTLTATEVSPNAFHVVGTTGRLSGASHSRSVEVREVSDATEIDVLDTLDAQDSHGYEMFWNIGNDVTPVVHGQGIELFHHDEKVMDLFFEADVATRVSLHRGEKRPRHLGWRFPKFGKAEPGNVVRIAFESQSATIKTKIRFQNFNYKDRGLAGLQGSWSRSATPVPLNYLQVSAKSSAGAQFLVVCFSAVGLPGDFTYNYKATIDDSDVAALYILDDFGDQGAYYLQDHGNRGIFESVQQLIGQKLSEAGLGPDQLVTVGSSKGGTAALLHGIAAGAGRIFAGAPQTRIGSFVSKPHPNILKFMTGSDDAEAVRSLDRILYDTAESARIRADIRILVGEKDHHYKGHVLPFMTHLRDLDIPVDLAVLPGLPHSEIGRVYRLQLHDYLQQLVASGSPEFKRKPHPAISSDSASASVSVVVSHTQNHEVAFRLYRESEVVSKRGYGMKNISTWKDLPPGRYRVRVFSRAPGDNDAEGVTSAWVTL